MEIVVGTEDTLVIGLTYTDMPPDEVEQLKAEVAQRLPGIKVVIISGVSSMVVVRPDPR